MPHEHERRLNAANNILKRGLDHLIGLDEAEHAETERHVGKSCLSREERFHHDVRNLNTITTCWNPGVSTPEGRQARIALQRVESDPALPVGPVGDAAYTSTNGFMPSAFRCRRTCPSGICAYPCHKKSTSLAMIRHWMPSSTPSRTGSAIHGHHPSSPWFKVVSPPSGSCVPAPIGHTTPIMRTGRRSTRLRADPSDIRSRRPHAPPPTRLPRPTR